MSQRMQPNADMIAKVNEMREPVQAIRGFLSIVLAGRAGHLTEPQQDFLSTANRAAGRLARLIDDLELLRYSPNGMNLITRDVNLRDRVEQCVAELRPMAANLSMELRIVMEGDPNAVVAGDPGRIDQILLNLLENALKYGEVGTPIHIRLRGSRMRVLCIVENTDPSRAIGTNPQDWFTPYSRHCEPLNRSANSGYGLGLTVVDTLVRAHSGRTLSRAKGDRVSIGFVLPRRSPYQLVQRLDHSPGAWVFEDEVLSAAS